MTLTGRLPGCFFTALAAVLAGCGGYIIPKEHLLLGPATSR